MLYNYYIFHIRNILKKQRGSNIKAVLIQIFRLRT